MEKSLSKTALTRSLPRGSGYSGLGWGGHLTLGKGWQELCPAVSWYLLSWEGEEEEEEEVWAEREESSAPLPGWMPGPP